MGQLVVTPEVVASKINNMKENKSSGVDGLSPKIMKETVEQISTPLSDVFNMLLLEGIVHLQCKGPFTMVNIFLFVQRVLIIRPPPLPLPLPKLVLLNVDYFRECTVV